MHRQKIINKRANWQLYDKDNDKRVTLNDIRKMIVAGAEFRVVDDSSGDDVTIASLLYIIVDYELSVRIQPPCVLKA